jgi:MFS family permease
MTNLGQMFGRRIAYNGCILVLLILTVVAGLVPTIECFIIVRLLSGFQGTYFHVAAQTIFAEYFPPVRHANL